MEKTYVPLFSEILDKVHKAKTKDKKVAILREHKTDLLKMLLKIAFDPKIEWVFPEGEVPYTPNEILLEQNILFWHKSQKKSGDLLRVQIM